MSMLRKRITSWWVTRPLRPAFKPRITECLMNLPDFSPQEKRECIRAAFTSLRASTLQECEEQKAEIAGRYKEDLNRLGSGVMAPGVPAPQFKINYPVLHEKAKARASISHIEQIAVTIPAFGAGTMATAYAILAFSSFANYHTLTVYFGDFIAGNAVLSAAGTGILAFVAMILEIGAFYFLFILFRARRSIAAAKILSKVGAIILILGLIGFILCRFDIGSVSPGGTQNVGVVE